MHSADSIFVTGFEMFLLQVGELKTLNSSHLRVAALEGTCGHILYPPMFTDRNDSISSSRPRIRAAQIHIESEVYSDMPLGKKAGSRGGIQD